MSPATLASPPRAAHRAPKPVRTARHTTEHIQGRFRPIQARELAIAAWLLSEGHLTLRQLRCYFALHEMAERRRYTRRAERPLFTIEELSRLVGGRGSATALSALRTDLRRLASLGLAVAEPHKITFPSAFGSLEPEFAPYLDAVGEGRGLTRPVPVPRRMLRALAGGFRRAETLYVVATLLRCVFWKKREGLITVDGRIKSSWVAETFQLSLRAVKGARAQLRELGWIQPLEAPHWLVQRFGAHTLVRVDWKPGEEADQVDASTDQSPAPSTGSVGNSASVEEGSRGGSAPRTAESRGGSAPPRQDQKTPLTRKLNTRKLARAAGPSGVSRSNGGRRERAGSSEVPVGPPRITDIQVGDLRDTERLLELHAQAVEQGYDVKGESGRMDFLAMANRALCRGSRPGAMLRWLLVNGKSDFITQADEDAAAERLRRHLAGPPLVGEGSGEAAPVRRGAVVDRRGLSEDEHLVEQCIRAAKKYRGLDPFLIAERGKGWTREQWERVRMGYERKQAQWWSTGTT